MLARDVRASGITDAQEIDVFVRAGAALTVLLGVRALALSLESYFAINIALVGLWLLAALWVVRKYATLSEGEALT